MPRWEFLELVDAIIEEANTDEKGQAQAMRIARTEIEKG